MSSVRESLEATGLLEHAIDLVLVLEVQLHKQPNNVRSGSK
jgi:hypothetical protein